MYITDVNYKNIHFKQLFTSIFIYLLNMFYIQLFESNLMNIFHCIMYTELNKCDDDESFQAFSFRTFLKFSFRTV